MSQDLISAAFDYEQVHLSAKSDMDFLAALALPEIFQYSFPPLYKKAWELLRDYASRKRDFSQMALGLPRGFGKTLVIKLFILYCILFSHKRFILVISENEDKAKAILSDIEDMLNEDNIRAAFGDWKAGLESNTLTRKKFSFRGRSIILKAAGSGSGIRGITEKNIRPDVMVFDDIQSREDSESEQLSTQLYQWMTTTAMKAKSPEGCLFLFIANMYPTKGSLLRKLKANPNWVKFIVGGILVDGTSLWEELHPLEQLLREFANDLAAGTPQAFYSEVLNDENASQNTRIDIGDVPAYPYSPDEVSAGGFVVIDPSTDKVNSDFVALGAFNIIDGRAVCREIVEGKLNPGKTIEQALKLCFKWNCPLVAVESNSYQYSLLYWSEVICQQLGITGITFVDVYTGMLSKTTRILNMFKDLVWQFPKDSHTGVVDRSRPPELPNTILHPEVRAQIFSEITGFNPLRRDNKDNLLDLLTYVPQVMQNYGHMIVYQSPIMQGAIGESSVHDEIDCSPF